MALKEQIVEYQEGGTRLHGFFCHDDSYPGRVPAVLISHTWCGRDAFVERKARRLAWHGYAAFALDMYGEGKCGKTVEENSALMAPFMQDRALLARRMNAALTAVKSQPSVDPQRVAAMGFCFGGLCALDLARSGADVRGVVSFHGMLKPNGLPPAQRIQARILMMHGYDDPMAPPEDVLAIAKEFTQAGADWQLHAYGHTVHAFTNPEAKNAAGGMAYNERADRRSWHTLLQFLEEVVR
jgi:dienelactone hydrolase